MVISWLTITMSDFRATADRSPEKCNRNEPMGFEILVFVIYGELVARVSSLVPAEGKNLAWVRSATRRASSNVPELAYIVIIGGMASAPLQRIEVHASGHWQSPHKAPHKVRARMSRSFSVTAIGFLQTKKSRSMAGDLGGGGLYMDSAARDSGAATISGTTGSTGQTGAAYHVDCAVTLPKENL